MNNINGLPPFKRFCVTIGNLPSSYVDSMSYYECLMWLCKYLKDTVIPAINENAEAVNELINWFNNLDVQDEIDNKLDEMVESGELQEIISEYLNSQAMFGYDTVQDMKESTNLINGSFAKTLGYHAKNDGGSATYKIRTITNEDIVDESFIIAMEDNTLVAELIYGNEINPDVLGAYGDGTHDDLPILQKAINKGNVKLNKKIYYVSDAVNIPSGRILYGNGGTLRSNTEKYAIEITGGTTTPKVLISVKDLNIDTQTNGGNGIYYISTYFVYFDNINIDRLTRNGAIGFNQINGFNDTITNSRVLGHRDYSNTYGIKISTTSGEVSNMTNNKYDTLLLQRLTYGVRADFSVTSNMNEFNNIGFSDNDYCYYITGYADPVVFNNTRMESTLSDSIGFYITGGISSRINNLNAYNIPKVIVNEASTDCAMYVDGAVSLTGTNQSPKYNFIESSTQNIYYSGNTHMLSNTYNFLVTASMQGNATVICNNGLLFAGGNPNGITASINNKTLYRATENIQNMYGRKGTEVYIYTTTSNLKIAGTGSSTTNQGPEVPLTVNKLYHILFIDNNKFIVE